jgi:hypothetical protein
MLAAGQEEFGVFQAGIDSKAMCCRPKQGFELPNEMEMSYVDLFCDLLDRRSFIAHLDQEVPSAAESTKKITADEHGFSTELPIGECVSRVSRRV